MLEFDRKLVAFLKKAQLLYLLTPRDIIFQDNNQRTCFYYKSKSNKEIHYYDFTNLYAPFWIS